MRAAFAFVAVLIGLAMWGALLLAVSAGRRLGRRRLARGHEKSATGIGVIDAAVYSLSALLLAFSFNGAASRYDQRRQMIAEEVITTSTALARAQLASPEQATQVRSLIAQYIRTLLEANDHPESVPSILDESPQTKHAREQLWTAAMAVSQTPTAEPYRRLTLPALNDLFAAVQRERLARRMHPPPIIPAALVLTTLAAALFAGYGLAATTERNTIYVVGFTGTLAMAIYVIIELEFPRLGMVHLAFMIDALRGVVSGIQ